MTNAEIKKQVSILKRKIKESLIGDTSPTTMMFVRDYVEQIESLLSQMSAE
jgi:hypothetical protein